MPKKNLVWFGSVCVAIGFAALYIGHAKATPAAGFVGTTVALGRFSGIDTFNQQILLPEPGQDGQKTWLSWQKAKGATDVYVQNNVWQPGGDTGWHSHPGHSLIIVTAGAVTDYESDDPNCAPTVYTQGMGFVDSGGDHVHLIRNEGSVPASTMAIQVVAAGASRRIDMDAPSNCHP